MFILSPHAQQAFTQGHHQTSSNHQMNKRAFFLLLLLTNLLACKKDSTETPNSSKPLFELVKSQDSNIEFNNLLTVSDSLNYFTYRYFFMGSGISIGDFNSDGLEDIFFGGNVVDNQLYLNKGNLQFEDISKSAKIEAKDRWIFGSSVIDINGDGLLDLYLSVAGQKSANKENILYVNQGLNQNGIPTFKDRAKEYGIADKGNSVQSTFLDYDQDGDLDLYVANYPEAKFDFKSDDYKRIADQKDIQLSDHLYQNNGNGTFTDVTVQANVLNYGLSIGIIATDFNNDHLTDLYISNDFHTPDKFYINNGDGTFSDQLNQSFQHTSFYGMGVDAADYNNDGLVDLLQVDMTPPDNYRSKANMASMNPKDFYRLDDFGYQRQYMYNCLQENQGIRSNQLPFYADLAKMHNVGSTDWSWACLFADLNNDAFKDVFITNGTRREMNNKDYFKWLKRIDTQQKIKHKEISLQQLTEKMPSFKVDNLVFENQGGKTFKKSNKNWGIEFTGFSNGAAYADFDNDGDLELLLNNVDSVACLYQNLSRENTPQHFLQLKLKGPKNNRLGLGTKITLKTKTTTQYHEQTLVRGYVSSVSPKVHFGLGTEDYIEEVKIVWPDKKTQILKNINANQVLEIDYLKSQNPKKEVAIKRKPIFQESELANFQYQHIENEFDDFKREILLPHQMSSFGPGLATKDLNADGIDDVFVGSAMGSNSFIYLSEQESYRKISLSHPEQEDVYGHFFDADLDGDDDLYIACGGNEKEIPSIHYQDRLYINQGNGEFELSNGLAQFPISSSIVKSCDIDQDGDLDLFVGGRQIPGLYPNPATSYVLENKIEQGKLKFEIANDKWMPELEKIGMVTDALWTDYDSDQDQDLLLVGEWMPITLMKNKGGKFTKVIPIKKSEGWWNCIREGDFDKDGNTDFILGNLGLNYKYKASTEASFDIYGNDFDENGKQDIVLSYKQEGEAFPVRGRQCSSEQMPILARRFETYESFATANLETIYGKGPLKTGTHYPAWNFANSYLKNKGNGQFELHPLPNEVQSSSVNSILSKDLNKDGWEDLILAGNLFDAEVETPRNDACYGWVMMNDGQGNFNKISFSESGLYIPFETRQLDIITFNSKEYLLVGNNNGPLQTFQIFHSSFLASFF